MSENEVIQHIRDRWPGLGDHASCVLWNYTCFPFCDPDSVTVTDEGNLSHWLKQVEAYVNEMDIEWQRLYG